MGKKKKRGGGGGGGGGGQQQNPAEEGEEQQAVAACDDASAEAAAEDSKDKENDDKEKDKEKDKGKDQGGKDKDGKEKGKKPPPQLPVVTAVLKVDMHCDGCAKRIRASVHRYPGKDRYMKPRPSISLLLLCVEGVAMEVDKGSMTVVGRFDAKKLRDRVANKTRKKVDLVGNNNVGNKGGGGGGGGGGNNKGGGGGGGNQQKGAGEEDGKPGKEHDGDKEDKGKGKDGDQDEDKGKDNKGGGGGGGGGGKGKGGGKDNKKPAVPVIGTVVLKIGSTGLHCQGCMNRIRHKLFKIKGVEQVKMDMAKNQVTVTGTMDTKALPEKLRKKLRRPVDVVPAKQDGKDKDGKQQQDGGGGGKDKDGKEKEGGKDAATKKLTVELEAWKAAFYDQQALTNAEFMLSDENPNACTVM
ncbi:unnamed protein product [Urochloa decumbens]|uniref:HMA domain-containing protein n=1 Tax=Urochloa decumbens TaxID=240449 RepID=A0ABC9EDN6_9POAL